MSNASLPPTRAYVVGNMHAVQEVEPAPAVLELLAARDRAPEDRALDDSHQAAELLTFLSVAPGARVAELASGKGYLTELLARAVGPRGVVFGQNAPAMLTSPSVRSAWTARLARPADANVVRVERNFDDPLPPSTRSLDLVFLALDYGDLVPLGVDRDAMNHAVHLALRGGGRYMVLEETPREGALLTDLHALHVEESRNARREIESAGFTFVSEGRFLRDSGDPRDWDASPRAPLRGEKRDRFVLVFEKP
jgi:predicted methyltransferase